MDAGHGPGLDVVGDVAEDNAVLEGGRKIVRQRDPQAVLNVL